MNPLSALSGVNSVIVTPFTQDGDVDFESLRNVIDNIVSRGVHAVTLLGVAGEAHKLSIKERDDVAIHAFEAIHGRCPVVIGTSANSTEDTILASRTAQKYGASAVMIAPPKGLQFGPQLFKHYKEIAHSIDIPIILQDYAEVTGVNLSPQNMADLLTEIPQMNAIKLETPPTAQRIGETRESVTEGIAILGGNGGIEFFHELVHGADGTMNGFSYPEALLDIWNHWQNSNSTAAQQSYDWVLPLLKFEFQPRIGLAIRKEILRQRGWIKTAVIRGDAAPIDQNILAGLSTVLDTLRIREKFTD